jgi:hypothetical protein
MKALMEEGHNHKETGDSQFTPKNLRAIRRFCLATGTITGLQTWLLVIMGCKMFLRPDELITIEIKSFVPTLFVRKGEHVIALFCKVMGKCDKKEHGIWIWADDENPDLCPIRPLLIYVWLLHIRSGSLFPKTAEFTATQQPPLVVPPNDKTVYKPVDGEFVTQVQYDTFLKSFKKICEKSVPDIADLKVGLHMFRKTAYLLGIWGKGEWGELMESARHTTDRHAKTYRKDALAKKVLADTYQDPENNVSDWKPVHSGEVEQSAYINLPSTAFNLQLATVAEQFVKGTLGFKDGHPFQHSQVTLLEAAHKYTPSPSVEDELKHFAEDELHLQGEAKEKFFNFFQRAVCQKFKEWRDASDLSAFSAAEQQLVAIDDTPQLPSQSTKRKRGGENDLPGYKEVANMKFGQSKVRKIIELNALVPAQMEELTQGAKTFVIRTSKPVAGCLKNHCNNNVEAFCRRWEGTFKQKFKTECCSGLCDVPCRAENGL